MEGYIENHGEGEVVTREEHHSPDKKKQKIIIYVIENFTLQ